MKVKFRPKGTYLNMTNKNVGIIKEIQKLTLQSEILAKMMDIDSSDNYNLDLIRKMYFTLNKIDALYQDLEKDLVPAFNSKEEIEYR